jgi:hypothetical protein
VIHQPANLLINQGVMAALINWLVNPPVGELSEASSLTSWQKASNRLPNIIDAFAPPGRFSMAMGLS